MDPTRGFDGGILSALQVDLEPSNARDLSQCLRHVFRSKQRPVPIVQSALQEHTACWNPAHVRAAHDRIQQCDFFDGSDKSNNSTLTYMRRVANAVWFVQFLLEYRVMRTSAPLISEVEICTMITTLLQTLTSVATSMLGKCNSDSAHVEEDANESDEIDITKFHAPTVASFIIGAQLRAVNPYVSSMPLLLSPLWKGICQIATSMNYLPPELAEEALMSLLSYLREGASQLLSALDGNPHASVPLQHRQFQVKLLIFLVARISILLPLYVRLESESNLLSDILAIFLQLRGLTAAAEHSHELSTLDLSFLQLCPSLESKVEQCVVRTVCQILSNDSTLFHRTTLMNLLRVSPPLDHSTLVASQSLGKAMVLQRLLEKAMSVDHDAGTLQDGDVQDLLCLCEELLFSTLPHCHDYLTTGGDKKRSCLSVVLGKSLDWMTKALIKCTSRRDDVSHTPVCHLLMRWLAPPAERFAHPLTREFVVSLVHLVTMRQCEAIHPTSESPRSVNLDDMQSLSPSGVSGVLLLPLLVKLLFDPRTHVGLRRNVAGVLHRVLNCCEKNTDQVVLKRTVHQMIAIEFESRFNQDCKLERRKRKRRKSPSEVNLSDKRIYTFRSYLLDDLVSIRGILMRVYLFDVKSLDHELSSLCRDLLDTQSSSNASQKSRSFAVGQRSSASVALLVALLCGTLHQMSHDKLMLEESFRRRARSSLAEMHSCIVMWLAGQWAQQDHTSKNRTSALGKGQVIVTACCLCFIRLGFRISSGGSVPLDLLGLIDTNVAACAKKALQTIRCSMRGNNMSITVCKNAHLIVLDVTALLAEIPVIIPTKCPFEILQGIAANFKRLLGSKCWPIVACTMTALVKFASTLPSAHQGVLPKCLQLEVQELLQCRLQGVVYKKRGDNIAQRSVSMQQTCSTDLLKLVPDVESRMRLLTTNAKDVIVQQSYFLTMPTTDGRSAMVFFPPGKKSLDDIKFMLGADDLNAVNVRQLCQVRLLVNGKGCQLFSTKL